MISIASNRALVAGSAHFLLVSLRCPEAAAPAPACALLSLLLLLLLLGLKRNKEKEEEERIIVEQGTW